MDSTPWAVDGGAVHTAALARTLAYAALGGAQGVVEVGDLKVTASPTPDNRVRAAAGAAGILNSYPGQTHQAYIVRNPADDYITIGAAGSAARSDLIVARIDDPQFGGSAPLPGGPFAKLAVVTNVGAGVTKLPSNLGYPAIVLSRVDVPANTATITNAMLTDLREVLAPRSKREVVIVQPSAADTVSSASPTYANEPATGYPAIKIPTWATRAIISLSIGGVKFTAPDGKGNFRARIGTDADAVATQATSWDTNGMATGGIRQAIIGGGKVNIPASYRGTLQEVAVQGTHVSGASTTRAILDTGSTVVLDIEFVEDPTVV